MNLVNSKVDAVAFDLDGLMFNTEELYEECGAEMLARRGKELSPAFLAEVMGRQSHIALQAMIDWYDLDATVPQLQDETDAIFAGFLAERLEPMHGLLELLAALETHNIPKAITTSSRRGFVDDCLQISKLDGRFAFILSSEDITDGKPEPEIYLTAAERFGISPERMLVLEDSPNGCLAAVRARSFAVAIPGPHIPMAASVENGSSDASAKAYSGAKFIADNLSDRRIYESLGIPIT